MKVQTSHLVLVQTPRTLLLFLLCYWCFLSTWPLLGNFIAKEKNNLFKETKFNCIYFLGRAEKFFFTKMIYHHCQRELWKLSQLQFYIVEVVAHSYGLLKRVLSLKQGMVTLFLFRFVSYWINQLKLDHFRSENTSLPMCPMLINLTESSRIDSELRGWFHSPGPSNVHIPILNSVKPDVELRNGSPSKHELAKVCPVY